MPANSGLPAKNVDVSGYSRASVWTRLSTIAAFAVPGFSLWLPSGYSWGAVLLLLAALFSMLRWGKVKPDRGTLTFAVVIVATMLMWALQTDPALGSSRWDRSVKYLLATLCLFYVVVFPPSPRALIWGVIVGSLGACGIAGWQVYGQEMWRASGHTNAIQFGNLALLLAVMSSIFLACLHRQFGRVFSCAAAFAIFAGLLASSLSLSRGGWLALLLVVPFVLLLSVYQPWRKLVMRQMLWLVLATGFVTLLNAASLKERFTLFQDEVTQYQQSGSVETSIGQRLEHWRMAIQMGSERPIFGWGDQGYKARKQQLVAAGSYDDFVLQFDHAHNELIDVFAKRGLVGFGIIFLFYAVPAVLFWPTQRRLQRTCAKENDDGYMLVLALRLAGVSIPVFYAGFGLTQVFFAHNSGTMFYLFMLMLLWGAVRGLEGTATQKSALRTDFLPSGQTSERKPTILHFVTGGFSGATQVAVDLVAGHQQSGKFEALLVLRRKSQTTQERLERLQQQDLHVQVVTGWMHSATVRELAQVCREFKPDILVAHGFSEHIWGRYAALEAGVPHMVHVEHNSRERYTTRRLRQAHELAARTDCIIGCSEGVRNALLGHGFPAEKVIAISNGIRIEPYRHAATHPWHEREAGIVMAARFARQKDHATLLHAIALLRSRGLTPAVYLAGGGKLSYQYAAKRLANKLGLQGQVHFLGFCKDVPGLLMRQKICVLASHYEGMPLSLIEGMAAGCAVVGSRVVGVQEVINDGVNGLLVNHADPVAMADALEYLLQNTEDASQMAAQARNDALDHYRLEQMCERYEAVFTGLLNQDSRS